MTTVKSFANRFVYETQSLTVTTLMMTVSGPKTTQVNVSMRESKAYLITPTNLLTFSKTVECSAVKQYFMGFSG